MRILKFTVLFAAFFVATTTMLGQGGFKEVMKGKGFSAGVSILSPTGDLAEYVGSSTGIDINYTSGFNYFGSRARVAMGLAFYGFSDPQEVAMSGSEYSALLNPEFGSSSGIGNGVVSFEDFRIISLQGAYDFALIKEKKIEPFIGLQFAFNILSGNFNYESTADNELGLSIPETNLMEGDRLNIRPRIGAQYRVAGGLRVYAMYTYNRFTPDTPNFTFTSNMFGLGLTYIFGDSLDF